MGRGRFEFSCGKMTEVLVTFLIGMGGVVVGGFVTFMVQRHIQERSWRNERAEKICAPLLDQLDDVETRLNHLTLSSSWLEWQGLREKHLIHFIAPGLREKLWSFFDVELHNLNIGLEAAVNLVIVSLKEEILQKVKEEERGEFQRTTHYLWRDFLSEYAKLVLIKYIGFGGITAYPQLERDYSELEKYFETKIPFDDFIENLASKIKDQPFFKEGDFKRRLEQLIIKTQELRSEVKKEMKIKNKDAWD